MKPVIDYDECTGCATCVELCPEVFELGDDEKAYVKAEDKCDTCDCQEAADTCPSEAITFEDQTNLIQLITMPRQNNLYRMRIMVFLESLQKL